jgi:hypothetical protein
MKNSVHVDYGPWEEVTFEDRADVGQLPHDATCSCGVEYRKHFDANGKWIHCSLAFRPQNVAASRARVQEKAATVPQWGGIGGR